MQHSKHTVTSRDGTKIGYRKLGNGSGLLIVHGSMSSGYNHIDLAEKLSKKFTVYLIDRRGRGLSEPYKDKDTLNSEIADIASVLQKTNTSYVVGISVGGLMALQAASELPIKKLAIYEPLIYREKETPVQMMQQINACLDKRDNAGAMATAMQQAQLGSTFMNRLPYSIMRFLSKGMLNWSPKGEYVPMKELVPALRYEGAAIIEKSGRQSSFARITADVLLLNGSKSSEFLKDATMSVMEVLPHAKHVVLPGLDHSSAWNRDIRGNPEPIAQELAKFFG